MMLPARSIWAGVRSAGTCSRPLPLQTMYRAHLLLSSWQYFFFIMPAMAGMWAILSLGKCTWQSFRSQA